jgi:outer membrane protein assembly factor BamB
VVGAIDSTSYLFTFSLDGKLIHKDSIGSEWVVNFPGSRCIPKVVDYLVYIVTGKGDVPCLNKDTGELIWKWTLILVG